MKITIDIDVTADEARRFFGLPDVAPMQEALIAEMTERLRSGLQAMDPETLWRQWMPAGPGAGGGAAAGMEAMRQFWDQAMQTAMRGGAGGAGGGKKPNE